MTRGWNGVVASQGRLIPRVDECISREALLSYLFLFPPSWDASFQFYLEDRILYSGFQFKQIKIKFQTLYIIYKGMPL